MSSEGALGYYKTADWNHIPVPYSASPSEKKEWERLPVREKVEKLFIKALEEDPVHSEEILEVMLDKCWKVEEFSDGPDILNVVSQSLKLTPVANQKKEPHITIKLAEGESIKLPYEYKSALSRDSNFFRSLFYGNFRQNNDKNTFTIDGITKDDFDKLIRFWNNSFWVSHSELMSLREDNPEIEESLQTAYDLLLAADYLNLPSSQLNAFFSSQLNKFSLDNSDDMESLLTIIEEISALDLPETKGEINEYLLITYLKLKKENPNGELVNTISNLIKQSNVEEITLHSFDNINDYELKELLALTPKLRKLKLLQTELITDDSIKEISKLTNLESLTLKRCKRLTGASLVHLKELKNLHTLYIAYNTFQSDDLKHIKEIKTLKFLGLNNSSWI